MAQAKTQDNQKVFQSATEKFKSFFGSVGRVSTTKNMELIYSNMSKLFDAFTKGALTEQGANSEILLRTVYRSLNDDFLKIIQDSDATDKIVELIKEKQESLTPETVDTALVSETTKKVVTKTLDPIDCDPMSVVLDFVDELQTAILQVKLNLSREYERQKILRARSYEGQQEDLDRLKQESSEQSETTANTLEELQENQKEWDEEQFKKLEKLHETFKVLDVEDSGTKYLKEVSTTIQKDKQIQQIVTPKKYDSKKILEQIQGIAKTQQEQMKQVQSAMEEDKKKKKSGLVEKVDDGRGGKQKLEKNEKPDISSEKAQKSEPKKPEKPEKKEKPEPKKNKKFENEKFPNQKEKPQKSVEKPAEKSKSPVPVNALQKIQGDAGKDTKQIKKDSKLNVKPSKNGMCTCPICGTPHLPGQHQHKQQDEKQGKIMKQPAQVQKPLDNPNDESNKNDVQSSKVTEAIGKIHGNLQNLLKDDKFKNSFMLNYTPVQKGVMKTIKRSDKQEEKISDDLKETQKGINSLKKPKKSSLLMKMFNPAVFLNLIWIAVGGLIIIALLRIAWRKWKAAYMPKPDGEKMSIFGIEIPGWDQIKAFGIGIYNWFTIGLPNWIDRLKVFFGDIWRSLFGKKGIFKNAIQTRNTLRKILLAILIGATKKVGGMIVKILFTILSFIPYVGPIFKFLKEFGPAVWSFIMTQVMLIWSNEKAKGEQKAAELRAAYSVHGQSMVDQYRKKLYKFSGKIKPYKGQAYAIPGLQAPSSKFKVNVPAPSAIMRTVPVRYGKNLKNVRTMEKTELHGKMEEEKKKDEKAFNANSIMQELMYVSQKNREAYDEWETLRTNWGESPKTRQLEQEINNRKIEFYNKSILPEREKIRKYIEALQKYDRFKDRVGLPLYDPEKGWNPTYRIYATDLRSPLPFTPWEKMHSKADIQIGQPAPAETNSIGYMPFKWLQDGRPIFANPIGYEIARAMTIYKLWENVTNKLLAHDFKKYKKPMSPEDVKRHILETYGKRWKRTAQAVTLQDRAKKDGFKPYLYGDMFTRFINKWRAGKIDHGKNNLEYVQNQWENETLDGAKDWVIDKGVQVVEYVAETVENVQRVWNYDRDEGKVEEEEVEVKEPVYEDVQEEYSVWNPIGWVKKAWRWVKKFVGWVWKKVKRVVDAATRKARALLRFNEWLKVSMNGLEYTKVRDFMLDSGILKWTAMGQILNPIGKAIALTEFLVKINALPKAPSESGANGLHHLMWNFFEYHKIAGYKWANVDGPMQAAFAQSLIEYLAMKVVPQWNICERLLSDDITYKTDETKNKMKDAIGVLHDLLSMDKIMQFLGNQLRFPNMKVKIIDESNATGTQFGKINRYKTMLGIPTNKKKDEILREWQGVWQKLGGMNDEELQSNIEKIRKQIGVAKLESSGTGDITYENQLRKMYIKMMDEKQKRLDAQATGGTIVKNPSGNVQVEVTAPPKTMAEIEEERRKEEAERKKKEEEERIKREEEEKKRLAAEAERRKQLKIAEAKMKEMEAIKKQEQKYEEILSKLVNDPGSVTDEQLSSLKDEVKNIKQEAENRIAQLPREEREMKLALIRGDKISEKTFGEVKETAIGLHGSLQGYIEEVNQIPVGNVLAIQKQPGGQPQEQVPLADSDSVDMGDA